jgi:hypothetical protein
VDQFSGGGSAGLAVIAVAWGNIFGLGDQLGWSLGFFVPVPYEALCGAVLILFAWQVAPPLAPTAVPSAMTLSLRLMALTFVSMLHIGAVPEFIYKGF